MEMDQNPEERGQSLIEYALLMVLVALVVILIVTLLGESIVNLYNDSILPLLDVFTPDSTTSLPPAVL